MNVNYTANRYCRYCHMLKRSDIEMGRTSITLRCLECGNVSVLPYVHKYLLYDEI